MPDTPLNILVVTQMYPGPDAPDLGVFVQDQVHELRRSGHQVRVIGVTRRGGGLRKHLGFAARVVWGILAARRVDVVYAHFLAPAGALAAIACRVRPRCGLVVVAHGRDVRNIGERGGVAAAMRLLARRADDVVAVSGFLRDDLVRRVPELAGRVQVIDQGVDVERVFTPGMHRDARARLDGRYPDVADGDTAYVFVGSLDERKNVVRLADAFGRLERGTLVFVGDGPHRDALRDRERVHLVGHVPHEDVVTWIRASDVLCLPSIVEPFGQVLIEAMACERSVVATNVGGPPEFVAHGAGVLVDPTDVDDIERGLREAAALPRPNVAARTVAREHDVRRQTARMVTLMRDAVAARSGR